MRYLLRADLKRIFRMGLIYGGLILALIYISYTVLEGVVNDGSIDDSEKVISLFAQKDERIVVINQEHNLQGTARNAGIKVAKGEYIGFVDADDWIDLNYFEYLT